MRGSRKWVVAGGVDDDTMKIGGGISECAREVSE